MHMQMLQKHDVWSVHNLVLEGMEELTHGVGKN